MKRKFLEKMVECKICGRKFDNKTWPSVHLHSHNTNMKEYYDKFIKKKNEGKCKECGKNTNFSRTLMEYRPFCSHNCANNNLKEIKKRKNQTFKKYGVYCFFQSEKFKKKKKKTCLKRYGVEYPAQSEEFKNKKKKTCLKRYGVEHSNQSEEIREKSKQTCLKRYDVENPMKSKKFKNKRRKNVFKK
jgi:endogenous inhibitor of DNA gyrase (YacG/DUF329 family)